MKPSADCNNSDPLKLIRQGTSQDRRPAGMLDPASAAVDERTIEHGMVFAQAYSRYLKYHDPDNAETGDWEPFFSDDVSMLLAVAAVQDVAGYRQRIKEFLDFLSDRDNESKEQELRDHLDFLYSACATLTIRLDLLKEKLPSEFSLKKTLQNLMLSLLAPALKQLIAFHKGGKEITVNGTEKLINLSDKEKAAPLRLLGENAIRFSELSKAHLSKDWSNGKDWTTYYNDDIDANKAVYGDGTTLFELADHIAMHNLFTSILDQYLKVYARLAVEARQALEKSLKEWDLHEPHYTLFLAFLRLMEYARKETNTLTGQHLDFYYREILKLKEKEASPGRAHLLAELARQFASHEIRAGEPLKAGKDGLGRDAFFANDRDFVANQAKVVSLKTVYQHQNRLDENLNDHQNRLFASPTANSDDGAGGELTSVDQSWHPFFNKIFKDGKLTEVKMPRAEVGFAIASHYLWMGGGERTVTVRFAIEQGRYKKIQRYVTGIRRYDDDYKNDIICQLTTEKGWLDKQPSAFVFAEGFLTLKIDLSASDPAITPYLQKKHGFNFTSDLPLLLIKLRNQDGEEYKYDRLRKVVIKKIELNVKVAGLKTLAVSNDFGPVDSSKPFQPFGAMPVVNSALVIGSGEAFRKQLVDASLNVTWQNPPAPYGGSNFNIGREYLSAGKWESVLKRGSGRFVKKAYRSPYDSDTGPAAEGIILSEASRIQEIEELSRLQPADPNRDVFRLLNEQGIIDSFPYEDSADFSEDEFFSTSSRNGFVRLVLESDFGRKEYEQELIDYIIKSLDADKTNDVTKPEAPVGPFITELTLDYTTRDSSISLNSSDQLKTGKVASSFFHLTPFGQTGQHPADMVHLLPQFDLAEFYIGISGLKPPQNLALLFQVADGTADPLSSGTTINWSCLCRDRWKKFGEYDLEDRTAQLLNSGIMTFAIPGDASDNGTLMPVGMHWLRASVASSPDAVCRLRMVAAQAFQATFADKGNDPAFSTGQLPAGSISALYQPVAAVKKITQPFETFGGRGREESESFYTRVSERLRHKDRAITLWDYERLVLEAFPQIYRVKCLNHTHYEPETGKYRELAPGHVTVVTIPNQLYHNLRDPLRPYTSLGLLKDIKDFLGGRFSCFTSLHVTNPLFEEVKASFKVKFNTGEDITFSENRLQTAITRFLSPWAFPGGASPEFGGRIQGSALINFIEDQPYVDYVTDFTLYRNQEAQGDSVEGVTAVSILVSAGKHDINPIKTAGESPAGEKCLCEI